MVALHALDEQAEARTAPALDSPCGACPWRQPNHGRRHAGSWYTKANLRRLWGGLRRGEMMSCHPTDPSNPVPPGMKPAPANVQTRECAGAHLLLQREVDIAQRLVHVVSDGKAWSTYRKLRPRGLTRDGLLAYLHRATFGGVPLVGGCHPVPKPNLNDSCSADPVALPWPITLEGEA
jgi:hypothetical protein